MYVFLIGIMFIPNQWRHVLLSRTDSVVKEVAGFTAAGWSARGLMEGGEGWAGPETDLRKSLGLNLSFEISECAVNAVIRSTFTPMTAGLSGG